MHAFSHQFDINAFEFHHVGVLVDSIESSTLHYELLFGKANISKSIIIDSQKVKVCFVKISPNSYIELVEPIAEDSQVFKLLKKRISYYHMAYKVNNITDVVSKLESCNYKPMSYFHSEAFEGKRCIFLFSPEAHLIELIEK